MTAAPLRRYRSDGEALTDGFTLRLPVALNGDLRRLARIHGVTIGDYATRAIEERIERELGDPDIAAALEAVRRIDERFSAAPRSVSEHGSDDLAALGTDPGDGERSNVGASPQGPRKSGETPARSAAPARAAERPTPRASRSAAPVQPETRAPAAAKGSAFPSAAPAQADTEHPSLGSRLRAAREARGLSQVAVATALDCSGPTVSLIEQGKQGVGSALAARIEAWIAKAPTPKHPNTKIAMRSKAKVTPSSDGRAPNASQSAPRALPKGMELYSCPALKARITEKSCAANKARAKGDIRLEEHCPGRPGVRKLAEASA